jgi:hypothetical protein
MSMNMAKHKRTARRRLRNLTECPEQAGLRFIDGTPRTLPSLILTQDYLNMRRYIYVCVDCLASTCG